MTKRNNYKSMFWTQDSSCFCRLQWFLLKEKRPTWSEPEQCSVITLLCYNLSIKNTMSENKDVHKSYYQIYNCVSQTLRWREELCNLSIYDQMIGKLPDRTSRLNCIERMCSKDPADSARFSTHTSEQNFSCIPRDTGDVEAKWTMFCAVQGCGHKVVGSARSANP